MRSRGFAGERPAPARAPAAAALVAAVFVGAAACSGNKGGGVDARADVAAGQDGDGSVLDLMAHEHVAEHGYDDAGRPGELGAPLTGAAQQWSWIPFPESRCRDGSSTGIGLNVNRASSNVMVFLDQGGACFQGLSCLGNLAKYGALNFGGDIAAHTYDKGIFNRNDPDNPVRDWSFVLVPYCTGDVHAGNQPDGAVIGVTGTQQFMGYHNLDLFLARVVPTFSDAQQVLLVGSSAGGFGVLLNADHVARWFAPTPITVISDSGPPMPNSVVPPCLEQLWLDTWALDRGPMIDCGVDCPSSSDYMVDHVLHFGWRYPSYRGGLISSTNDHTDTLFFGLGNDSCTGAALPAGGYQAGLLAVRDRFAAEHAPFGTFLIGQQDAHIWLMADAPFATTVGGTSIKRWVGALLNGDVTNVGP